MKKDDWDRNRHDNLNNKVENWSQKEMMNGHKKFEKQNLVQKFDPEQNDGLSQHFGAEIGKTIGCNKLTSHSIVSVGQAVGVRSGKGKRQITFEVDTAACGTVVPARHPATRRYICHWDAEARVPYWTAGKSVVLDEGRRLLVSKDTEGKNKRPLNVDKQRCEGL